MNGRMRYLCRPERPLVDTLSTLERPQDAGRRTELESKGRFPEASLTVPWALGPLGSLRSCGCNHWGKGGKRFPREPGW